MDYSYTQKERAGSHNDKCKTPKCDNLANGPDRFCRTCRDNMNKDLVKNLQKVERVDKDLVSRKQQIERLQHDLRVAEQAVRDLERQKFLEKMNTYFENDLVSSDHRYTDGFDTDGTKWTLETHCTIVRVQDIPENLYFGHVTLKISSEYSGEEYIWHYGVPVLGAIPQDLKHDFWTGKPNQLKISDFADFNDIPSNTLLSDIMKRHLDECAKYFKKQTQWKDQVWYSNDTIGNDKEKATDVLERIKQIKKERQRLLDPSKAAAQHQALIKETEEKEEEELRKLEQRQEAQTRRLETVAAKRNAGLVAVKQVSVTPVPSKSTDDGLPARLVEYKEDILKIAQQEKASRAMLASSLTNQKPKFIIPNRKGREEYRVAETDKDTRAKPIRKAAASEEKAMLAKDDEEIVALNEGNKKRRDEAKKIVEDFLKKIEDEKLLLIKNLLEKEDQDQSVRDSLINDCKKLIMYIHGKNDEIQREINIYLEEEKDEFLLRIKTSKTELLDLKNKVIQEEIEKFKVFLKNILQKEKNLFSDKYDYQHNPKTITDIKDLIQFYTNEYIPQLEKWSSFDLFEEDTIKTFILKVKTKVNREEHLKKLNALLKLKKIIDFYTLNVQPKEEKLLSVYRYNPLAIDDINDLIEFYKNKVNKLSTKVFGLQGKDFDKIRSDIKSILNPEQRLEELKCLKELNILAEEYTRNIIPKEQLLNTSYRMNPDQVENINLLIDYYRDKCLPTLQKFSSLNLSNLNREEAERIRDDITYIKKLVNPEQRLEKLYMMEAHNIIQYYAQQSDDLDEAEEVIIRNIRTLTNDDKKKVTVLTGIVSTLKAKGELNSTKQLLEKYKLDKYREKESKEFLKNDAKDLERIFRQRKLEIKTHLANIDPMGPEGDQFRTDLYFLYKEYIGYIDYIVFKLDDDDDQSTKDILELLDNLRLEITSESNVLDNNEKSYQNLIKIEEYYKNFIAPEMKNFEDYGEGNVDSLISYYKTFRYNLHELVINRLKELNDNDSKFIRKRIESLEDLVDASAKILLLPNSDPPSTTENNESDFEDFNALRDYYISFDDNKDENFDTIVRNMMLFDNWTYDESTKFVQHVKDFMSKMKNEKHFSTKSVIKYYDYL